MKIIAVSNQKGGVCKTTTASVLSDGLVERNFKVLRVDMDPQCDLSCLFDVPEGSLTIMDFLDGKKEAVLEVGKGSFIIPGSPELAHADSSFDEIKKFFVLREALEPIKENFDYVIIDCPPSYGTLTINALVAADEIIVPLFADKFAIKGLNQLYDIFSKTKTYFNPKLKINGVLVTRFDKRTSLHKQVREELIKTMKSIGSKVYEHPIRNSIVLSEMQAKNMTFDEIKAENKDNGAISDYEAFIDEFLKSLM